MEETDMVIWTVLPRNLNITLRCHYFIQSVISQMFTESLLCQTLWKTWGSGKHGGEYICRLLSNLVDLTS